MRIRTGDNVKVISGKNKGKKSKVVMVSKAKNLVYVEDVNQVKKHVKGNAQRKSEIVTLTKPIHRSNVMVICAKCKEAIRMQFKVIDGKKKRLCKKCSELV